MTGAKPERIPALDLFRYLTVTLAIISHVVIQHTIYDETTGGLAMVLKLITRMATPSLIILMGVMIEIASVRRFASQPRATMATLFYRAALCAGAYGVLSLYNHFWQGVNASGIAPDLAWTPTGYGAIFLTYAVLLLLAPAWLYLRVRFGLLAVAALSLVFVSADVLFLDDLALVPGALGTVLSVLFGIGDDRGPAIIHALGLMTFGMALANLMSGADRDRFARPIVFLAALTSALVLAVYLGYRGPVMVAHLITDMDHWRSDNHAGYYAFGMLAALVLLALAFGLMRALPEQITSPLAAIGRTTLFYFFLSCLLIQAVPAWPIRSPALAIAVIVAYCTVLGMASHLWLARGRHIGAIRTFNARGRDGIARLLGA